MATGKKLLYVITKSNWGGAQKYVYLLAVAAQERGYEVAIVAGGMGPLIEKLRAAGVRVIAIPSLTRDVQVTREFSVFADLVRIFKKEQPDVVHVNSAKAGGLGCLAARLAGVPNIIFTAHGWAFNESRPWWQRLIIWKLSGLTIWLSHTTICVSNAIARDMRWFPFTRRKLVVIHNGIAPVVGMARNEAREKLLPGHTDQYWIGMMSELHPIKRVQDAIEGFAQIKDTHPNAILVVCGEGEERAKLEKLIRDHALGDRVFLLGFVADAPRYLAAFDLFLHTAQSEAFSLAILEAGAAELPVVATEVGGIPEVIEDGISGLLIPPRSPAAVALALDRLISDAVLATSLASALHTRVLNNFSQEKMTKASIALYTQNTLLRRRLRS